MKTAQRMPTEAFSPASSGTGSHYDVTTFAQLPSHTQTRITNIPVVRAPKSEVDIRSAGEHVANILRVFEISITELGGFFGVTRQAVYKWKANECEPDSESVNRIRRLSWVADKFDVGRVSNPTALLKMKAFEGQSLFELVRTDKASDQHIRTLLDEARTMQRAYQQATAATLKTKPSENWRASISVPGEPEAG